MEKDDFSAPESPEHNAPEGLAQRMARYRAQLVADGRVNAVKMLDSAVEQSGRPSQAKGGRR